MSQLVQESLGLKGLIFAGGEPVQVTTPAELVDGLEADGAFGYVEICDPERLHLTELAERLGEAELAHPPASTSARHVPVVSGGRVRLSAQRVLLEEPTFQLTVTDLHIFVLPRLLVIDHDGTFDTSAIRARLDSEKRHRDQGVGWLLWLVIDELTTEAGTTLEALDDELDEVEDILTAPDAKNVRIQGRVYRLRKSASRLRRTLLPLRDAVDALLRREAECVSPALFPLYQGLYDRLVHQVEWADSLRDLVTALSDTQIAMEGNRLNVIMKKVTSWAAIFALPAAVTGFFGQNIPFPGAGTIGGFWASTVVMVAGCLGLYITFKRKDWL